MTNLIIGGTGFVGRNLARALEARGESVLAFDRNPDSLNAFRGQVILGDAQDSAHLLKVLMEVNPTTVYHLAANSDIQAGVTDASLDFGDTLMTTVALQQALLRHPVERLVFASSSAIFGQSESALGEESDDLPSPVSAYGKAKLASELVLEALNARQPQLRTLMVRFPNVVGTLGTHGVVYDFVKKLKANPARLDVLGDGHQTKPYVHVSELIEGILYFLQRTNAGVERVNIGPADTVDVRSIAHAVCEAMNLTPEITYGTTSTGWQGDVPRYSFDASKMRDAGFTVKRTSLQAVRQAAEELARELR